MYTGRGRCICLLKVCCLYLCVHLLKAWKCHFLFLFYCPWSSLLLGGWNETSKHKSVLLEYGNVTRIYYLMVRWIILYRPSGSSLSNGYGGIPQDFEQIRYRYKGHSEIIDTTLAFWTLSEIKHSDHSKVKRVDWNGKKKRESRSAVSKHGDRGGSGLGYGRQQVPTVLIQSSNQLLRHHVKQ